MAKPTERDKFVTVTASVIVIALLILLTALWFFVYRENPVEASVNFAIIGPIVSGADGYSVSTRVAVQTSKENAEWAEKNRAAVQRVIESTLIDLDPAQVHAVGGLLQLQQRLQETIKRELHTDKVEQILLTDFLLQTGV